MGLKSASTEPNWKPVASPAASTPDQDHAYSSDDDDGKDPDGKRRELPADAVAILKSWLLSPEHFDHPYPSPQVT